MAKLVVTAKSVGSYFFGQWESHNPILALKTTFTTSVGTISAASLFSSIAEWVVYEATQTFWWVNPIDCILKCILTCVATIIMAYTRFLVVAHSFTGEGFATSGTNMILVMARNFSGAYVNGLIGVMVVHLGSTVFALGIFFASWQWIDSAIGVNVLEDTFPQLSALGGLAVIAFFY